MLVTTVTWNRAAARGLVATRGVLQLVLGAKALSDTTKGFANVPTSAGHVWSVLLGVTLLQMVVGFVIAVQSRFPRSLMSAIGANRFVFGALISALALSAKVPRELMIFAINDLVIGLWTIWHRSGGFVAPSAIGMLACGLALVWSPIRFKEMLDELEIVSFESLWGSPKCFLPLRLR